MRTVSANEAKARFGQLLDTARREPVTIEKHGRPVAVMISKEDYDAIEAIKLARLREQVQAGIESSRLGRSIEISEDQLDDFVNRLMETK